MAVRIVEHPAAGAEVIAAAEYYEGLVAGLGHEFMARIEEALRDIAAGPARWPPALGGSVGTAVRSRSTRSFPYSVVYLHDREDVIVLAYPHDRQGPGYWQGRELGTSGA